MSENVKVGFASLLGLASPSPSFLVEVVEPLLKTLLLLGQVSVAVITFIYILQKWKNARDKARRDNDE